MTPWKIHSLALVVLGVASCEAQPLQIGSGITLTGPHDGGVTAGGACAQPPDASTFPAECAALLPCGSVVRIVFKAGPPPDLGRGGVIVDGTYDLTDDTIYESQPTAGVSTAREAIRISAGGTRLEYVTASDGFTILASIAPMGASLNSTTICPGPGVSVGPYYTATADTFTVVNGLYVKVFARRF